MGRQGGLEGPRADIYAISDPIWVPFGTMLELGGASGSEEGDAISKALFDQIQVPPWAAPCAQRVVNSSQNEGYQPPAKGFDFGAVWGVAWDILFDFIIFVGALFVTFCCIGISMDFRASLGTARGEGTCRWKVEMSVREPTPTSRWVNPGDKNQRI